MRRRRLRKLLLAKLLRERGAGDDEGEDIDDEGDDDHRLARLLVGRRMVRRAKLRRLVLAKLLRERGEGDDEGEDIDDEGDDDQKLIRFLIGARMVRRRRGRRRFSPSCSANAARMMTMARTSVPTTTKAVWVGSARLRCSALPSAASASAVPCSPRSWPTTTTS